MPVPARRNRFGGRDRHRVDGSPTRELKDGTFESRAARTIFQQALGRLAQSFEPAASLTSDVAASGVAASAAYATVALTVLPRLIRVLLGSLSALLHISYSLVLQAGYDRAELGVVYPVARGTGPVLTMLAAVLVLGERPGVSGLLGALTVVVGVLVVTGNPLAHRGAGAAVGMWWGVFTGITIAAYTLWDSFAIAGLRLTPIVYYAGTLLLETLMLTPLALRHPHEPGATLRRNRQVLPAISILSPIAYVLVLTALRTSPVALVAPLREASIVLGSLLAFFLFHETHLARRLAGAGIVLLGIVLVSL